MCCFYFFFRDVNGEVEFIFCLVVKFIRFYVNIMFGGGKWGFILDISGCIFVVWMSFVSKYVICYMFLSCNKVYFCVIYNSEKWS